MLPDLLHLLSRLILDHRISSENRAMLGIAVAYVIVPVELIPESLVGPQGLVDDIVVMVYALDKILNRENQEVVREHWSGQEDILHHVQTILAVAEDIVSSRIAWEMIKAMLSPSIKPWPEADVFLSRGDYADP